MCIRDSRYGLSARGQGSRHRRGFAPYARRGFPLQACHALVFGLDVYKRQPDKQTHPPTLPQRRRIALQDAGQEDLLQRGGRADIPFQPVYYTHRISSASITPLEELLFNTKAPFVSSRWLVMGTMDTSFVTGGVLVHAPNINAVSYTHLRSPVDTIVFRLLAMS